MLLFVSNKALGMLHVAYSLHLLTVCISTQGGADGDTIMVYPSKIDPHCEALFFVLSASDSEVCTMNLSTPDSLQFNGYSAGTLLTMHFLLYLL